MEDKETVELSISSDQDGITSAAEKYGASLRRSPIISCATHPMRRSVRRTHIWASEYNLTGTVLTDNDTPMIVYLSRQHPGREAQGWKVEHEGEYTPVSQIVLDESPGNLYDIDYDKRPLAE